MSQMFGDNKTVVDSATKIHAKLHKRLTALSFYRVRKAMAAGFSGFHQAMAIHEKLDGDAILEDWSMSQGKTSFEYRASKMYLLARAGLPNPNPTTAGAIASLPFARPRDPLGEYRRGFRRDPNAFVSLKEDKQWDSWERSTVAQA
jgi:hypothetical protein